MIELTDEQALKLLQQLRELEETDAINYADNKPWTITEIKPLTDWQLDYLKALYEAFVQKMRAMKYGEKSRQQT